MNKAEACRIHIKRRFKERFNIDVNRHDLSVLSKDIQNEDNVVRKQKLTNRITAFDMIFKGKRCVVIYDVWRKVPVTVLTKEMKLEDNWQDYSQDILEIK